MEEDKKAAASDKDGIREESDEKMRMENRPKIILAIVVAIIVFGGLFIFGMTSMFRFQNRSVRNFESFGRPMMVKGSARTSREMMGGNYARVGTTGQVTAIDSNNLKVKDSSGTEQTIIVSDTTSYTKSGNIAKQSDLQVNNVITAKGTGNSQGQIVATAVRIW